MLSKNKKSALSPVLLILVSSFSCQLLVSVATRSLSPALVAAQTEENQDQEASPAATESLKDRIDKVVEEKKEQVEKKVEALTYRRRGFIGQITRVSEEAITIENRKGTQVVPLKKNVMLTKDDEPVALDDIAVGEWVTVLGLEKDDEFFPLQVIVTEDSLQPPEQRVSIGTITEVSSKQISLRSRETDEVLTYDFNKQTDVIDNQGEEISYEDLFEDMQCLTAGFVEVETDEDDEEETTSLTARLVQSLAPVESAGE